MGSVVLGRSFHTGVFACLSVLFCFNYDFDGMKMGRTKMIGLVGVWV